MHAKAAARPGDESSSSGSLASAAVAGLPAGPPPRRPSPASNASALLLALPLLAGSTGPLGVPPRDAARWATPAPQGRPASTSDTGPLGLAALAHLDAPAPPRHFPRRATPWAVAPRPQSQLPRTGLRPAAPIGPVRPDQYQEKHDLDHFETMGGVNKFALNALFGVTPSGRSRAYVHDIYGYMPFADGYGGAILGSGGDAPWWWNSQERSPYMSASSWGKGTWLPERPWSTCPPDCEPPPFDLASQQPE